MATNAFTIKDLANLSGIKAHTIRIWEQRYNFLKPNRTDTNIRYYSNQELKTLLDVSLLNKYGYKISHINRMADQELKGKILALTDREAQLERLVNELIAFMIDLDVDCFERVLDGYILARGIDKTISQVIFPFLNRIGILWAHHHLVPAQDHLVGNILRQKLIVGIEAAMTHRRTDKTVLLFLPEGEYHELGLLYACYLLKTHGVRVLYLGPDVPLRDIEFVCTKKNPDYLYTHPTGNFNMERFRAHAAQRLTRPLVVCHSAPELLEFITTL